MEDAPSSSSSSLLWAMIRFHFRRLLFWWFSVTDSWGSGSRPAKCNQH
jgi:hypothetical protein